MNAGTAPVAEFGARLEALRIASGISYRELSDETGRGLSTLHSIMKGNYKKPPDFDVVRGIVETCVQHARTHRKPLPAGNADLASWRMDLAVTTRLWEISEDATPESPAPRSISAWEPLDLGVHRAITPDRGSSTTASLLTPYGVRAFDRRLRRELRGTVKGRLVVLTGGSCVGKTRAAYEAVAAELPAWPLLRPFNAQELLAQADLRGPAVLWLNELQRFLEPPDGAAAAAALMRAISGSDMVIAVATMPGETWDRLTDRPAAEDRDLYAEARDLLEAAHHVPVPSSFLGDEEAWDQLRGLGVGDGRLAHALRAAENDRCIVQVLAGGPELLRRYRNASKPRAAAVITAAVDARRVDVDRALPTAYFRDAAPGYLTPSQRIVKDPREWLADALEDASAPVKGVAALTGERLSPGLGEPDHYSVHDFLIEHIADDRRAFPIPAGTWQALLDNSTDPSERLAFSAAARERGLYRIAAQALVPLAREGRLDAAIELARLLLPELRDQWERAVAQAGDPSAMWHMAIAAGGRNDREEAARWWRRLVVSTSGAYMSDQVGSLAEMGLLDDAVEWLAPAVEANNAFARDATVRIHEWAENYDAAIALLMPLARRDHADASRHLSRLYERAGNDSDQRKWLRNSALLGDTLSMRDLADLHRADGDLEEAQLWLNRAAQGGSKKAVRAMADRLVAENQHVAAAALHLGRGDKFAASDILESGGEYVAAAGLWADAAGAGDSTAAHQLGSVLLLAGDERGAEQWFRASSDAGHPFGRRRLLTFLLDRDRGDEAWEVARLAADQGQAGSVRDVVDLLVRRDIHARAIEWLMPRAADGELESVELLIDQLELSGERDSAAKWRLRAAELGHGAIARRLAESYAAAGEYGRAAAVLQPSATNDDRSARELLKVLAAAGDIAAAEELHRKLVLLRFPRGVGELVGFLNWQDRAAEAEIVERYGIEPDGSTAPKWEVPYDALEAFAAAVVSEHLDQ